MNEHVYLLYLDRYHQGDPLFLKELAQHFARADPGQVPAVLVHASGEKLERTLEAEGLFPEREEGIVKTETPQQEALAERAVREANQDLVALFTDEVVTAVGLQGCDRGVLKRTPEGDVEAGTLGWVEDLVKMRVVPVISTLAAGPEGAEEVPPVRAAVALATALEGFTVTICFLVNGALPEEAVAADALSGTDLVSEPAAVRHAARAHDRVWLTDLRHLFAEGGPQGRQVQG